MRFIYTKLFGVFAVCMAVLAALVFLQTKGWLYPVKNLFLQMPRPIIYVAKNTTVPVKNFFLTIYRLRGISQENVSLNAEVRQMQLDLAQLEQEKRENETLRKELEFSQNTKLQLVSCAVLSRNPFGLTETLVLSCGTGQGVSVGQAVVSQGFLVGKIILADKGSATAQLITNSGFSTDARLSKTGDGVIVRGSFGSGLVLDQLPQNSQVAGGWLVVTAGINEQIPKDIPIGEVGEVISSPNDLFKKTTLLSPIDLDDLGFVFVAK